MLKITFYALLGIHEFNSGYNDLCDRKTYCVLFTNHVNDYYEIWIEIVNEITGLHYHD